jgi:hypothetical protein
VAVRERLAKSIHLDGEDRDLVVGKSYSVAAIEWWNGGELRVFLHTVEKCDYPYPYPLEMFEVIDSSLPASWCLVFESRPFGMAIKRMSFSEWAEDDNFYELLIDGDEKAIGIYKHHKVD